MSHTDVQNLPHNIPDTDDIAAATWKDQLLDFFEATSRQIALLAAWIATCGSLFMSETLGWQPCLLCWYQRILMYPIAIILALGIVRRDRGIQWYVLPFSITGMGVALYHYLLIKTNWFPPAACAVGVPCDVDYIDWLGFINIPFLALIAFTIITLMMGAWVWSRSPIEQAEQEPTAERSWLESEAVMVGLTVGVVVALFFVASTFV